MTAVCGAGIVSAVAGMLPAAERRAEIMKLKFNGVTMESTARPTIADQNDIARNYATDDAQFLAMVAAAGAFDASTVETFATACEGWIEAHAGVILAS